MKKLVLAFSALSLVAGAAATPALASPCRNKAGKFIKCPKVAKPAKVCRNAKGKFTKCTK